MEDSKGRHGGLIIILFLKRTSKVSFQSDRWKMGTEEGRKEPLGPTPSQLQGH